MQITPTLAIDDREIHLRFVTAPGPGGQNVNKVATAVQLTFDVAGSPSLDDAVRERLIRLAGRRVGRDGVLTLQARRYRTQAQNREDALARLAELVRRATVRPRPRRPTRPTKAAVERRLETKRRRSQAKRRRRRPPSEG